MLALPFQVWTKNPPISSFHAEALAAGFGLLAMALALAGVRRPAAPRTVLLPIAFAGLLLVQGMAGQTATIQQALLGALYLAWAAGLCVLAATLSRVLGAAAVVGALAAGTAAGATLAALTGLAQQHGQYGLFAHLILMPSGGRVWGNLAQPNHLADYLALGLASLCFLFGARRIGAWTAFPLMLLTVHVLGLTGARAVPVYLAVLLFLALAAGWRRRDAAAGRVLVLLVLALAAFLLLPLLPGLSSGSDGLVRLTAAGAGEDQRIALWQAAWAMFRDAPILGQGFGQFGYRHFLAASQDLPRHAAGLNTNAHNLVLHVAAEFGVVGLVALIAPVVVWVRGMLQRDMDISTWWIWAVAGVLLVHSLLEYPLWYAYFLGGASLLLGLAESRPAQRAQLSPRLWAPVCATVAIGWLVWGQVLHDHLRMEAMSGALAAQVAPQAVSEARTALLLDLDRTSLLAPFAQRALAGMIALDKRNLAEKIALNGKVMRAFPGADVAWRQAILLALHGEATAARAQWDRAAAAYPEQEPAVRALLLAMRRDEVAEVDALLQHVRRLRSAAVTSSTSKD